MYKIGIDLGGTNIACGVVDGTKLIYKRSVPTGKITGTESAAEKLNAAVNETLSGGGFSPDEISEIGIGVPGTVNTQTQTVEYACNVGLENSPLPEALSRLAAKPVFAENDANAAAWGEFKAGCGREYKNIVMLTLGTGVGGGIITDGRLYSGFNFSGAEIGHMVTHRGGRKCACGRRGCFEKYASATGLKETTRAHMRKNPGSLMWRISGGLEKVTGRTAFEAAKRGDKAAKAAVNEYIADLACGVVNIINIFQPEAVILGGGVANEGDGLLLPVRDIVNREDYARNSKKRAVVKLASLGNDAGIIGAALLGSDRN